MAKNSKNKAVIYIIIFVILIAGGLYLKFKKTSLPVPFTDEAVQTVENITPITIGSKSIQEENFTGKVATVSGESVLAQKAQAYIDESVAEFKKNADKDVPDMREQFGADSPTAQYEIDIDAKEVKGAKAQSIILLSYTYTGGAHGSSVYKVITTSSTGTILSLSDIIRKDKQDAFTDLVKKELNKWSPEGSGPSPVFPDEVKALKFSSFTNWSLDDKNLTIYFSQYEIGPGVLGAVAFPLSRAKVKDFLEVNY